MYLLNAEVTLDWEILATNSPPALGDLDLVFIQPDGETTYVDAPFAGGDYTAPTATTVGLATALFTPTMEGLWRIRLVVGTSASFTILSKVEMFVFDSTLVVSPTEGLGGNGESVYGTQVPYDINFYMQGYMVPNELFGSFVTSRTITTLTDVPGSQAIAEESPIQSETTFDILHNGSVVGSIVFPVDSLTGTITLPPQVLNIGDTFQLVTQGVVDVRIRDVAVNIAACCTITQC